VGVENDEKSKLIHLNTKPIVTWEIAWYLEKINPSPVYNRVFLVI